MHAKKNQKYVPGCFWRWPTMPVNVFLTYILACASISLAAAQNSSCDTASETHIWISPLNPRIGESIKIMAVSTDGPVSEMALFNSQDQRMPLRIHRRGGPPWSLVTEFENLNEKYYRVEVERDGKQIACQNIATIESGVQRDKGRVKTWDLATEAFYAAWIETLFGAPPDEKLSFSSLEPILRNSERNFLHNYLGLNEDTNLPLTPDCADLPYTLRAYFAWKIGLPVAFRACGRGSSQAPPQCDTATIITKFTRNLESQDTFRKLNWRLINTVHSGALRTALQDEATDLYPVPLNRENLWPGTVFADPYGHVLVLVEWLPQTANKPGMLLAVDAQPDNSVARKRVWEGTALFAKTASAGPGFKSFRPVVASESGGWRMLSNQELIYHPDFAPFSLEQDQLTPDEFYARLNKLINPRGLEPKQAYETALHALLEQIETRVNAVNNGEAYFRKSPRSIISMPNGSAIFQTVGPWEDYATPSRDMRLLIAINVLNSLPNKILQHPDLFMLHGKSPAAAKIEIEQYHAKRIHEHSIHYTRTDSSSWELSLAEILARKPAFEMAYNPNDCPEIRWGAEPGTKEYAACRRHAPAAQRAKMEQYRIWFRETRRPGR